MIPPGPRTAENEIRPDPSEKRIRSFFCIGYEQSYAILSLYYIPSIKLSSWVLIALRRMRTALRLNLLSG